MTNEYYIDAYTDASDMAMALVRNGYTVTISMSHKPSDYWYPAKVYKITVEEDEIVKDNE